MAGRELIVSIFPDQLVIELFNVVRTKKVLIKKSFENFSIPLTDMNKVDVMDIEKVVNDFLGKHRVKGGKVFVVVFGDKGVMPYHELDLGTTNKREIKSMLPLEIEGLGESYLDMSYRFDVLGSKVKTYFLKKNIVENLGNLKLPGSWEISAVVPGYITYQGIVPGDGVVLDIGKDKYTLYGFRNGFISDIETGNVYKDYSIDRPSDPSPDYLVEKVENDVKQYLTNFEFQEGIDIEMVTVVVNFNTEEGFTPKEMNGVYFDNPKDYNDRLEINEDSDMFKEKKSDSKCKYFYYSSTAYGLTYLGKSLYKYDFSPEKLNLFYKNILLTAMSFALLTVITLPSLSLYTDKQIVSSQMELKSYETSITDFELMIADIETRIELNDSIIDDYNDYVSSLSNLSNVDRNFVSSVMEYLPENTPSTILVQEMKLIKGSKKLILNGVSDNYKDIGSLAIQLESFGYVKINWIDKNELMNDTGYPFEIEMSSF